MLSSPGVNHERSGDDKTTNMKLDFIAGDEGSKIAKKKSIQSCLSGKTNPFFVSGMLGGLSHT